MATRKEDKEEQLPPEENPVEEQEAPEPETPPTPTPTVDTDALIRKALDEQYTKLNSSLTRLGQENKRLREQLTRQPTEAPSSKIYSGMLETLESLAKGGYSEDPTIATRIASLKSEATKLEEQQRRESEYRKWQIYMESERDKMHQQIKDAGLNPDDEMFEAIEEAFEDGKLERAQRKLDRIISNKDKETQKPPEKKEEKSDVEEALRKEMETRGLLKTETGQPSASAMSPQDAMKAYIAGKMTAEDAKKRGVKF